MKCRGPSRGTQVIKPLPLSAKGNASGGRRASITSLMRMGGRLGSIVLDRTRALQLRSRPETRINAYTRIEDVMNAHPENRQIWNEMASHTQTSDFFSAEMYAEVFEPSPIKGTKGYVYFCVQDAKGRVLAALPTYITQEHFDIHYLRGKISKAGRRITQTVLDSAWGRENLPRSESCTTLFIGNPLCEGALLFNPSISPGLRKTYFTKLLGEISRFKTAGSIENVYFRSFPHQTIEGAHDLLVANGYVRRSGEGWARISLEEYGDVGAYAARVTHGHKGKKEKLLEGNFVLEAFEAFLRAKKRKGFPARNSESYITKTREIARGVSRRVLAQTFLELAKLDDRIPKGEGRAAFLDQAFEVLVEHEGFGEIEYITRVVTPENIEAIFHLFEFQADKHGEVGPPVSQEWFERINRVSGGRCVFHMALIGDSPLGFRFVYPSRDGKVHRSIWVGFFPGYAEATGLYQNLAIHSFQYAKGQGGVEAINLGNVDATISVAKKNLGARILPTDSYWQGNRSTAHKTWTALRRKYRHLFGVKLGKIDYMPQGYFTEERPYIPESTSVQEAEAIWAAVEKQFPPAKEDLPDPTTVRKIDRIQV